GFWSVGPPTSSIINLATTNDVKLLALTDEQVQAAIGAEPVFAPYTLKAGLYNGMDAEVKTISIPNVLVVNAAMDEEMAYQITKAMFEHVDELIAVHPAANDTTPEFALSSTPIPLHPGAIRWYEEAGHTVPDKLRP